jgi:hypothetical protein
MSETGEVTERLRRRIREAIAERDGAVVRAADDAIRILPPPARAGQLLEVRVRDAADVEVAWFVPGKRGSPFEQCFVAPAEEADALAREVVEFVCDLVAERRVLAWDSRLLRGGRRFLGAGELAPSALRQLGWVVSWRGTHDWSATDSVA